MQGYQSGETERHKVLPIVDQSSRIPCAPSFAKSNTGNDECSAMNNNRGGTLRAMWKRNHSGSHPQLQKETLPHTATEERKNLLAFVEAFPSGHNEHIGASTSDSRARDNKRGIPLYHRLKKSPNQQCVVQKSTYVCDVSRSEHNESSNEQSVIPTVASLCDTLRSEPVEFPTEQFAIPKPTSLCDIHRSEPDELESIKLSSEVPHDSSPRAIEAEHISRRTLHEYSRRCASFDSKVDADPLATKHCSDGHNHIVDSVLPDKQLNECHPASNEVVQPQDQESTSAITDQDFGPPNRETANSSVVGELSSSTCMRRPSLRFSLLLHSSQGDASESPSLRQRRASRPQKAPKTEWYERPQLEKGMTLPDVSHTMEMVFFDAEKTHESDNAASADGPSKTPVSDMCSEDQIVMDDLDINIDFISLRVSGSLIAEDGCSRSEGGAFSDMSRIVTSERTRQHNDSQESRSLPRANSTTVGGIGRASRTFNNSLCAIGALVENVSIVQVAGFLIPYKSLRHTYLSDSALRQEVDHTNSSDSNRSVVAAMSDLGTATNASKYHDA